MLLMAVLYLTPTSLGGQLAFRRFFMAAIASYVILLVRLVERLSVRSCVDAWVHILRSGFTGIPC